MWRDILAAAWKLGRFRFSLVLTALVLGVALFGPWCSPHAPSAQFTDKLVQANGQVAPPFTVDGHPLGGDPLGRDELSRLLHGGRTSLAVALLAAALALALGLGVGMVAGYVGGAADMVLMRFIDLVLSLPFLLIAIALNRVIDEPNLWSLAVLLGALSWTSLARVVRNRTLQVRQMAFVKAAEALGYAKPYILFHHILPNVLGQALILGSMLAAKMILVESAMSFLGLGVRPPAASWGSMLRDGQELLIHAPWLVAFPGMMVVLAVFAFNLVGESLRDVLDARSR